MLVSYRFGFGTFFLELFWDLGTFWRVGYIILYLTFWPFLGECVFTLSLDFYILVGHVSTEIVHRKISA